MNQRLSHREYLRKKRKRRFKKKLYHTLLYLSELEFHISPKITVCLICAGLLLGSLFLPIRYQADAPKVWAANRISRTIHTLLTENGLPAADVTLLLLPDTAQTPSDTKEELTTETALVSPLYGVYLTGTEVYWLTELYTSLSQNFEDSFLYLDGLKLTYHPYRAMLNRTLTASLLYPDGTAKELQKDALYYVVGTDSLFYLFQYLDSRSEHLLSVQPKDKDGTILKELPAPLTDKTGSSLLFSSELLPETLNRESMEATSSIMKTTSLNASILLTKPNRAGIFILFSNLFILLLLLFVIPRIKRICVWIRIYLIRRRKRGGKPIHRKERTNNKTSI